MGAMLILRAYGPKMYCTTIGESPGIWCSDAVRPEFGTGNAFPTPGYGYRLQAIPPSPRRARLEAAILRQLLTSSDEGLGLAQDPVPSFM